MRTQLVLFAPAALLLALLAPKPCAAQAFTFTLSPQSIHAGPTAGADQTFQFTGTLTNDTNTALYLNGDLFSVDYPLSLDDTPFQNTFVFPTDSQGNPLPQPTLGAGQSVTTALFDVTLPQGTAGGTYAGTFAIQGGPTTSDYGLLGSQSFTVRVPAAVPEASSVISLSLLLALGAAFVARKKVRRTR